jgi:hypothetical protein
VIEHGRSGFIVESIEAAVEAVKRARTLPRARVRECFERRFTSRRMASDYVAAYEAVLESDAYAPVDAGLLGQAGQKLASGKTRFPAVQ